MSKRNEFREGYKDTKIGWIPEDWDSVVLDEIGDFTKGSGITKDDLLYEGFPAIRYGEIYTTHHYIVKEFYSFISQDVAKTSKLIMLGDLLFAGSGETHEEIGKCVAYTKDEKAFAGGDIIILRTSKGNTDFLGYVLNHNVVNRQKAKMGQGYSIVHIYPRNLKDIIIPFPPLSEQIKIAEFLSTWDQAIELIGKQIEHKQQLKKGLMQKLLTGKMRFPGFEDEWKVKKLGDVFSERNENDPSLDLLSITGNEGVIPREGVGRKDTSSDDKSNYKVIMPGDIGYNTMRMWQGRSAVSSLKGIVSPAYTIVTPKKNQDVNFYGYLFQLPQIIHLFYRYSQGLVSDTWSLKFPHFSQIKISVPGYKEQIQIAKTLLKIDEELKVLENLITALQEQKQGLMQKLLTGEVRVKV